MKSIITVVYITCICVLIPVAAKSINLRKHLI